MSGTTGSPRPDHASRSGSFERAYKKLPPEIQKAVESKLALLRENPRHPGLRLEKRCSTHWRICITAAYRLVFVGDASGVPSEHVFVGNHDNYETWLRRNC